MKTLVSTEKAMEESSLFRASKRRKINSTSQYKNKKSPDLEDDLKVSHLPGEHTDEEAVSVVRARKSNRNLRTGLTFSALSGLSIDKGGSLVQHHQDSPTEKLRDMSGRFVGSTGQVVDVDEHMIAYIDSEMARKRHTEAMEAHRAETESVYDSRSQAGPPGTVSGAHPHQHQLSEVDLDSMLPTTSMTSKDASSRWPPRKPRLGRDGKPLRPRTRKRRNSEDIARDQLVEQVLHEHRLENVYRPPEPSLEDNAALTRNGQAPRDTDAAFAHRFQQAFLDQVAERKQTQEQKKASASAGAADKAQGPKLGGSRAARAKMVAMQQTHGATG